jgi:hypothetical protein
MALPNTALAEQNDPTPPVEKAWKASQRARLTRGILLRMDQLPPITAEQRQQIITRAISLSILEDQR